MTGRGWSRPFRWNPFLAFLLPGVHQVTRGKVLARTCLLCLVGMAALLNVALGARYTTHSHLASMDPLASLGLNWDFFPSYPGDLAQESLAPDTITVIAEVTPSQITYERLVPIHSSTSILYFQHNFWPMFAFWAAVYLVCGLMSLREFSKYRGRAP